MKRFNDDLLVKENGRIRSKWSNLDQFRFYNAKLNANRAGMQSYFECQYDRYLQDKVLYIHGQGRQMVLVVEKLLRVGYI